jgi:hypothetical protein
MAGYNLSKLYLKTVQNRQICFGKCSGLYITTDICGLFCRRHRTGRKDFNKIPAGMNATMQAVL